MGCYSATPETFPRLWRRIERAPRSEPNNRNATQNYLLGLNYVQPGESEEVCAAHLAWGERFRETVGKPLPEREFDPETDPGAGAAVGSRRRLVVGYVSPDLYTHSVSYFASAPLTHHDPNRVRMIVYSATPREDAQTALLREAVANAGGEWKECSNDSERSLAETIRADGVDVLVELTGHTANNRLGALALRPAPVQVTWIGYPNTTGMREVDYRLTDAVADPRRRRRPTPSRSCVCPDVSCVTRLAPTRRRWRPRRASRRASSPSGVLTPSRR